VNADMGATLDVAWAIWIGVSVTVVVLACDLIRLNRRGRGGRK
jgi:hypothetical protein